MLSKEKFQHKMQYDPEFAEYVEAFRKFQIENGYTQPKHKKAKVFLYKAKTTLGFGLLIAGLYALAKYGDSEATRNLLLLGLAILSIFIYLFVNKSYANDEWPD